MVMPIARREETDEAGRRNRKKARESRSGSRSRRLCCFDFGFEFFFS